MAKSKSDEQVVRLLRGSTRFQIDVALIVLKFEPALIVKVLEDISKDIENGNVIQIAQSTSAISIICKEEIAGKYAKKYKKNLIEHRKELAALVYISPKKAIETPGVLSFILQRFSKNNLNVIEVIVTYTDMTFIIRKIDLFKALDLLGEFNEK